MIQQIYIITNGTHLKIGRAKNPMIRMKFIQCEFKDKLSLLKVFDLDGLNANAVERKAHDLLIADRYKGEWFNTSVSKATKAIFQSIDFVKIHGKGFKTTGFRNGRPIGERKVVGVSIPKDTWNSIKQLAEEQYRRPADVMRSAINSYLREANDKHWPRKADKKGK